MSGGVAEQPLRGLTARRFIEWLIRLELIRFIELPIGASNYLPATFTMNGL